MLDKKMSKKEYIKPSLNVVLLNGVKVLFSASAPEGYVSDYNPANGDTQESREMEIEFNQFDDFDYLEEE